VVGAEAGRCCSSVTAANRGGRRSSEGVDGVPVARVPKGGGEVVEKLLRGDVVLTRCSAGARRGRISRSTTTSSGGGARNSPALRSGGSGAQERVWMGWGVSANDRDAVCARDREWGVAVRAPDGEVERAADRSSLVLRETTLRCKKMELAGSMSCRESRWSGSTGLGSRGSVGAG
jgi:hypothetical protein